MKTVLVVLLLAIAANAHPQLDQDITELEQNRDVIGDLIKGALQKIINALPETIRVSNLNITLPTEGALVGGARISDLEITGHKQLNFTKFTVNVFSLSLDFKLELPTLNMYTKYWMDVTAADLVPLYGDGSVNIHLNDLALAGTGKASLVGPSVKDVRAGFSLGDSTTFDIHGLLNNEAFSLIVSSILNDNVAKFINDNAELLSNVISPIAQMVINSVLHGNKGLADDYEVPAEVPLY